ncbi:2Fe-2S iron-sulfur cluster-binding protein [Motiliproteus sp. SC1-56]|uniref:2Fe-2S iron-sulfur cluster-binding protein n=1 Tax=Motiliproteus sp. SC1-56 TaxID=2799565 RepID=UPI001A90743A|nr:2Fe-2S iron-sulfur cluster-binding protein [Motiliproteus sp. SC1-56]
MPVVTFRAKTGKKGDQTVTYAVAGSHTETVLKLAQQHDVPIAFDCEDGNCGTCCVDVSVQGDKAPMGGHLTDKERQTLVEIGKLKRAEIEKTYTDDFPPPHRLACQLILRDEDVLVEY